MCETKKSRTRLGDWIDKRGIKQKELVKITRISKNTVSKACTDQDYIPRQDTMKKFLKGIRKIDPQSKMSDFWDM